MEGNKKRLLQALEKSLGIVTTACTETGISRDTHYRWLREDPEYKTQVDSIEDISLDHVESQLFKQINEGSTVGAIFYLKTKGKKRGYIERTEQVVEVGGNKIVFENASKRFDVQSNGDAVSKESE